jgi:hypothetical protein
LQIKWCSIQKKEVVGTNTRRDDKKEDKKWVEDTESGEEENEKWCNP